MPGCRELGTLVVLQQEQAMGQRTVLDLAGAGWNLWCDTDAAWQQDELYLPPVDLQRLPVRPPTGGWSRLPADSLAVQVPGTVEEYLWDTHGDYRGVSWWWRTFEAPADCTGRHIVLHFEAVRLRAEVFLDAQLVGYDVIGNTPFDVDLTGRLTPGRQHTLAVRITDPSGNLSWEDFLVDRWGDYRIPPSHGFGGITAPVRLIVTDPVYVHDIFVQNRPEPKQVDVALTLANATDRPLTQDVRLEVRPVGGGDPVCTYECPAVACEPGETVIVQRLDAPAARLWELHDPQLYECHVTLSGGDAHAVRFGFRWFTPEIGAERAIFRLNGRRIVLRSAISWSFWPVNGIFPTAELAERHIAAAQRLGLNTLNFHRAIGCPQVLDVADERGLLYYEEPGGYCCLDGDEFAFAWAREKLFRMIRRDRNHPALVIYNMINEESWPATQRHEQDLARAQQLDPTRAITLTSAWNKPGLFDTTKLHARPYDNGQYIRGWCDIHHAPGPGCYCDEFYNGPQDYRLYTDNAAEIVFWGEEGAIATPPRLEHIRNAMQGQHDGWDGAAYREWYDAYANFLERKGWRQWFPSVDAVTTACAAIAYYYQGRTIENARLGNTTDAYVINGWEAEPLENHSGVVDCYRHHKGDPDLIARYNQPLYVAVKLRQKVAAVPAELTVDFHIVNEVNVHGPHELRARLLDAAGIEHWQATHPVHVTGGETFGELLWADVVVAIDTPGRYRLVAELVDAKQAVIACGADEAFLVDWRTQTLSPNGALLGAGTAVQTFLREHRGLSLPALADAPADLDYVVVEGFNPLPAEVVPTECCTNTASVLPGFCGAYYRGRNFEQLVFRRTDPRIDFQWETTPHPQVGRQDYSVRWEAQLRVPETGEYTFVLTHDDGARLFLDGQPLVDEWTVLDTWGYGRRDTQITRMLKLEAGRAYDLRLEYFQSSGRAWVALRWITPATRRAVAAQAEALLRRVRDEGATALILTDAEPWARYLAGQGVLQYTNWMQGGLYWLGSNFVVREHPLFADLPVNQALNWEYQVLARNEASRTGLLIDGEEAVVALVTGHQHAVATAVGVVPCGRGRIVLSTLDLMRVLNDSSGPADVARKLLCNYLAFAGR